MVYFFLAVLALAGAGFVAWLYWLAASWLVDSVIGWHNTQGFVLKVVIALLIPGIFKGLQVLRRLGEKVN